MQQAVSTAPRYRKPKGTERLMRWSGLWRRNENTLLPWINARYRRWHEQARAALAGELVSVDAALTSAIVKLRAEGLCHLSGCFPRQAALELSQRLGALVDAKSPQAHQHHQGAYALRQPLDALGDSCLDILDGPTGALLKAHYGSHFRVEWVDCYRTYPDAARLTSWRWHIDNVPAGCLKVMLLLTDSSREAGAMRYLPRTITRSLREAGYFGTRVSERELDLSRYARRAGMQLEPRFVEAPAGDVLVFDPNILHCGEPPAQAWRDVMTFFVLPSPLPWREIYRSRGRERIHAEPGGYPPSPEM